MSKEIQFTTLKMIYEAVNEAEYFREQNNFFVFMYLFNPDCTKELRQTWEAVLSVVLESERFLHEVLLAFVPYLQIFSVFVFKMNLPTLAIILGTTSVNKRVTPIIIIMGFFRMLPI